MHWNGNCCTEHTAKVRDRDNLSMDYRFKDAAPDDKPKYGQPKVNLLRAENNGAITLHETTVEGQATADKGTKARNSIWTKVEAPDTEFLVELNVPARPATRATRDPRDPRLYMKLDNDGLRFITLGFTELLDTQLQRKATEDVPRDSPDDTRLVVRVALGKESANVQGKIIWCEDIQAWELRYKSSSGEELSTDKDKSGNTFSVPGARARRVPACQV